MVNPTPLRHVHFSEVAESNGNGSTSTHLTPHINKHKKSINRRITLSPATFDNSNVLSRKSKSRVSLPPNFTFSQDSPGIVQELQFAPLSQILQERVKRRLRRSHLSEETNNIHESNKSEIRARVELRQLRAEIEERDDRLRQLSYDLEVQRQLGIDVSEESAAERQRIKDMELEVVTLKQEIEEKREQEAALPQLDGTDDIDQEMVDDDMYIINSPIVRAQSEDIAYPDLPLDQDISTPLRQSSRPAEQLVITDAKTQLVLPDAAIQAEREAFEEAIKFWTREASDSKAALQILTIELQSLGFGDATVNPDAILASIRESFSNIRIRLEAALPGQVPGDVSNADLIELLAEHLESLADRVAAQEATITETSGLQDELIREIDGLVDKLSDSEIRKRELERLFSEADKQTQEDEVFIAELEEKLEEIKKDHDMVQSMLNAKKSELDTFEVANRELDATVDKLGRALEGYRASEERLQGLIERMESEHHHALADLEAVHKEIIDDLEIKLSTETTARDAAGKDADEKQASITALELRIEQDIVNIDSLKQQLAILEAEKSAEQGAKEAAEGEVEEKTTFIEELEVKIEKAETNMEDLSAELGRLRDLNEAEKRQRVAAEEELDIRESKIEDLNNKLHDQGVQANQLRQKLFEIQVREKESVEKLERDAADREEQFQEDMSAEIARREQAEAAAASRNVTIVEVEEALRQAEKAMMETLGDRDEKITELAALADQLQFELEKTNTELDSTITELETLQTTSESRISQLLTDIADLQSQVVEQSATISGLRSEAATTAEIHSTAITERDESIANLNDEIFQAKNRIIVLESEKTSLERRVEAEAESMLELQASKDDEIAALKDAITLKQSEIENLTVKAREVDMAWEKLVEERDEEIEELKTSSEETSASVRRLTKLNASLKEKLRRFVRDSTATAQAMREDVEAALASAADKNAGLHEEGARVLEEAEAMDEVGEMVEIQASSSSSSKASNKLLQKFKKTSKSRRQYDSGIGVEEDGEESMLLE